MVRSLRTRFGSRLVVALACVAMFLFGVMPSGTHAPKLHSSAHASLNIVDHGDHTHDHDWDLDPSESETDRANHHHADHTHEKADLVVAAGKVVSEEFALRFAHVQSARVTGRLYGIDRPPRSVNVV